MSGTIGAVVLAAGGSSRLGRPKQFLQYRGTSLVRRSVAAALGGGCSPVIAVVGRDWKRVEEDLAGSAVRVVHNPDWEQGIGVSIRKGVSAIVREAPDLPALVLMVCDQPLVSAETISGLIAQRREDDGAIVASVYEGVQGVPALFGRTYFQELQDLPDTMGARRLFRMHSAEVIEFPFPDGGWDVDTEEDYQRLS